MPQKTPASPENAAPAASNTAHASAPAPAAAGSGAPSATPPAPNGSIAHPEQLQDAELAAALELEAKQQGSANVRALLAAAADRLRRAAAHAPRALGEIPLFLDASVRVLRDGKPQLIKGGVLVSTTDLTPAEIDELTARRAIRYATPAEMDAIAEAAK